MEDNNINEEWHIAYGSSEEFAPVLATSMLSLLERNKGIRIVFHIFMTGITQESINELRVLENEFDCKVIGIEKDIIDDYILSIIDDTVKDREEFPFSDYGIRLRYARIVAPYFIPENVEKFLFLGADTLIADSLKSLFEIDMGDSAIGMCFDAMTKWHKPILNKPFNLKYCNNDVILINVSNWKKKLWTKRIFQAMAEHSDEYIFGEQDGMNCAMENEIVLLPARYNVMAPMLMYDYYAVMMMYGLSKDCYYKKDEFYEGKSNPAILHFAGNALGRPWTKNSKHIKKEIYDEVYYRTPLGNRPQENIEIPFESRIQRFFFRYFPRPFNNIIGIVMQKTYGFFFVRRQRLD